MINVDSLVIEYPLCNRPSDYLRSLWGGTNTKNKVLNGVSFHVRKGEVLGILGRNGSGKSTLLKALAGVITPSSGRMEIAGSVNAILETSTGLSANLSGLQNIRQHLTIRGIMGRNASNIEKEIVEFAELGDDINAAARTYSAGMGARLAFAISTAIPSEVILLDEILSVGDEYFKHKCLTKIRRLCSSGRTVVLISHDFRLLEKICDRAIWLSDGKVRLTGSVSNVALSYLSEVCPTPEDLYPKTLAEIIDLKALVIESEITATMLVQRKAAVDNLQAQFVVNDHGRGLLVTVPNSARRNLVIPKGIGKIEVSVTIPIFPGLKEPWISAAIYQGGQRVTQADIQDSWGWDNQKHIPFNNPGFSEDLPYINSEFQWNVI